MAGFLVAPAHDASDPQAELADFFGAAAQVIAALVVALALFQSGPSAAAGQGARRFLSLSLFPLLGVGLAAALAGLTPSLPACAYRWLFAAVVGAGSAAVFATLLVGAGNLTVQRREGIKEVEERLDPDGDGS